LIDDGLGGRRPMFRRAASAIGEHLVRRSRGALQGGIDVSTTVEN